MPAGPPSTPASPPLSAACPTATYDAYQQAYADYSGDLEVANLIASFNILGQYANFDLLREQAPDEATLGIGYPHSLRFGASLPADSGVHGAGGAGPAHRPPPGSRGGAMGRAHCTRTLGTPPGRPAGDRLRLFETPLPGLASPPSTRLPVARCCAGSRARPLRPDSPL